MKSIDDIADELRSRADAATRGIWHATYLKQDVDTIAQDVSIVTIDDGGPQRSEVTFMGPNAVANAAYVESLHPSLIVALADALVAAQAAHRAVMSSWAAGEPRHKVIEAADALDTLGAAFAALESVEPPKRAVEATPAADGTHAAPESSAQSSTHAEETATGFVLTTPSPDASPPAGPSGISHAVNSGT